MNNHKKFRTNNGYCHILDDEIVLNYQQDSIEPSNRQEKIGLIESIVVSVLVLIIVFGLIANIVERDYLGILLTIGTSVLLINWPIKRLVRISNEAKIKLKSISNIEYKTRKLGKTYGYFDVSFVNNSNKKKIRVIKMPRFENNGGSEIKKAKEIFKTLQLID